jgi:hypothetical protein
VLAGAAAAILAGGVPEAAAQRRRATLTYGTATAPTLDALGALGATARAVAVVDTNVSRAG